MKKFTLIAAFAVLASCTKQSEAFAPQQFNDTIKVKWFHVNIDLGSPIRYSYYMEFDKPLPDTAFWVSSWTTVSPGQTWLHTAETFKLSPGMVKQYQVSSIIYEVQNPSVTSSIVYPSIDTLICPGVVFIK